MSLTPCVRHISFYRLESLGANLVAFVPAPQSNELLYSVLARYSQIMQYPNSQGTLRDWFGRKTVCVTADLPTNLETLARSAAHLTGWDADYWLLNHTLFPYFAVFHSAVRRTKAREAMLAQGAPYWLLGLMASRVEFTATFRYCPSCSAEDRAFFGFTYWRRSNQLPGVYVCPKHRVWLEDSSVPTHPQIKRHIFIAADDVIPQNSVVNPLPDDRTSKLLLDIANRSTSLLEFQKVFAPKDLRRTYQLQLAKRKLATNSGRLRVIKLEQALLQFFGTELPTLLGVSLKATSDVWWLRVLRKPRVASHTLYHVLMQQFLEIDLEIAVPNKVLFGLKPWRCLNRASDHFGQFVVKICEVDLTLNDRMPIGTFRCHCGFHYRRVGPDETPADSWHIDRMAAYGEVWLEQLRQGWQNPDLSLRALARKLGFDPATIRNQAKKLGLTGRNLIPEPETVRALLGPIKLIIDEQRQRWQKLCVEQSDATTTQLRQQSPALYTWLYRHDRAWLVLNSSTKKFTVRVDKRVNWEARDRELATQINAVAIALQQQSNPLVQLTKTRLSAETGQKSLLEQHIHRLPLSRAALARMSETAEAFAVRRIEAVLQQLLEQRRVVLRWQMMPLAGLRQERADHPIVAEALAKALHMLTSEHRMPTK